MALSVRAESFASRTARSLLAEADAEARAVYADSWIADRGLTVDTPDFQSPRGCFVVAHLDGAPVGCGGFRRLADDVAEIKRLFVRSGARRHGVGVALLRRLERLAADGGYRIVRLDTGPRQSAALALFRSTGYSEIEDYNGNELAAHWFEKHLS
jgi:GNAT superfamily N-acetyltransferase